MKRPPRADTAQKAMAHREGSWPGRDQLAQQSEVPQPPPRPTRGGGGAWGGAPVLLKIRYSPVGMAMTVSYSRKQGPTITPSGAIAASLPLAPRSRAEIQAQADSQNSVSYVNSGILCFRKIRTAVTGSRSIGRKPPLRVSCLQGVGCSVQRKRGGEARLPAQVVKVLVRFGAGSFEPTLWSTLMTTRRVAGIAG